MHDSEQAKTEMLNSRQRMTNYDISAVNAGVLKMQKRFGGRLLSRDDSVQLYRDFLPRLTAQRPDFDALIIGAGFTRVPSAAHCCSDHNDTGTRAAGDARITEAA